MLIGLQMYEAGPAAGRRQQAAAEALGRLAGVEAVNLQFRRGKTFNFPGIPTAAVLETDSIQVTGTPGRRRPLTDEIFEALWRAARVGGHRHFAFINADIVVTPAAVAAIDERQQQSYALCRTDVDDITLPVPGPVLTAGIDMFVLSTAWWPSHRRRFRPYVVGEGCWDNVYTAIMMAHSRGLVLNREPLIFHERHEPVWHGVTPDAQHNGFLAALDSRYFSMWCTYWKALEEARQRGASPAEEAGLQRDLLRWRRSPMQALEQCGRNLRARLNYRRLKSEWRPLSATEL